MIKLGEFGYLACRFCQKNVGWGLEQDEHMSACNRTWGVHSFPGRLNEVSQIGWLQTIEIYPLIVLGTGSLKSRCLWAMHCPFSLEAQSVGLGSCLLTAVATPAALSWGLGSAQLRGLVWHLLCCLQLAVMGVGSSVAAVVTAEGPGCGVAGP